VHVRCDGPGRLLIERAEQPSWAQPELNGDEDPPDGET
jgi:hypothetical protein